MGAYLASTPKLSTLWFNHKKMEARLTWWAKQWLHVPKLPWKCFASPHMQVQVLARKLSAVDKERIASAGVETVRRYAGDLNIHAFGKNDVVISRQLYVLLTQVDAHGKRRCVGRGEALKETQSGSYCSACRLKPFLVWSHGMVLISAAPFYFSWLHVPVAVGRTYTAAFGEALLDAHVSVCSEDCLTCAPQRVSAEEVDARASRSDEKYNLQVIAVSKF